MQEEIFEVIEKRKTNLKSWMTQSELKKLVFTETGRNNSGANACFAKAMRSIRLYKELEFIEVSFGSKSEDYKEVLGEKIKKLKKIFSNIDRKDLLEDKNFSNLRRGCFLYRIK